MTSFRFMFPHFLWLLGLLPLLAFWKGRKGRAAALQYSSVDLVREVAKPRKVSAGQWLTMLRLLALAFLILGLARPQMGRGTTEVEASGIDIVLAVDISGSMRALDFKLNGQPTSRIEVVKSVVAKFIEARPNDRIALVAFAGYPYLVSPLTLDHSWLQQNLERVQIGLAQDSTAIGSAIASSVNRLRDQPSKSKIIILLTDGVNNAGKVLPETAADAARTLGIKIYTIGAGIRGEALVPLMDKSGKQAKNMFGQPAYDTMQVDVDEKTLQKVAEVTNAQFYRATDTSSLKRIYSQIDQLEKTKVTVKKYEKYQELFHWMLIPGVCLLGLEILLAQTWLRRLP